MAKKVQKDENIVETVIKEETPKAKPVTKAVEAKVVSKNESISQSAKDEIVSKTSKKNTEVKTETPKKTEPVKVTEVISETKTVKENKTVKQSEPVVEIKNETKISDIVPNDKSKNDMKSDKTEKTVKPNKVQEDLKSSDTKKTDISGDTIDNSAVYPLIRYSDEDLEEFASIIKESKEEAMDELRMLKERLEDLTSSDVAEESMIYSMHMAEQGSEAQEKEKTYAQIQRIQEYLKKLEDAMDRIKNKTYGICRVCGCLIAKARLKAVPITTLSASYKIHQRCPEDGNDVIEAIKK